MQHDDQNNLLTKLIELLVAETHPRRIFLFGSRARGDNKSYSDFDFALEGTTLAIRHERLLREKLVRAAGIYRVDLIELEKTENSFRDAIYKQGKLLYERSAP